MRPCRTILAAVALTATLMGINASPAAASANGPKIDSYNWDGYSQRACARSSGNGKSTYTCRGISYGPYWIDWNAETAWQYVNHGAVSGGGDWVVTAYGGLYEGCYGENGWDLCRSAAVSPRTKSYSTGSSYYWVALGNWAHDSGTAFTCLYAMYRFDGDFTDCM